jgi:Ca-activated chloride channel family protein
VRRQSGRPHLSRISRIKLIAPAGVIFFCFVAGLSLRFVANSQAQNRGADQRSSIRVDVNLVGLIASVLDANNRPAPDLHQDQFEVYEEGKPQKIEVFEPETQQPLDLALMIDSSLSEIKELQFETDAAARFIAQVVRPDDRVGIFEFADTVTQLASFSGNVPQLQAAVRRVTPGDGTALYDAVYLGSDALGKAPSDRRKVLILITDAGETTSRADFETARRAALRAEALLYTIVIRPVKNENGRNTAGEHALETIADSTGGAMYYPDEVSQLDAIFERINRELRTQYRLAYYPQPRPPQGTYRSIEVRVKGNYKVRYRKSYYSGGVTN